MSFYKENFPDLEKADPTWPDPCSQNITQPELGQKFLPPTHL